MWMSTTVRTGLSTPEVTGTVRITGTSATFTVDTPEDTQAEADQTFTVTLTTRQSTQAACNWGRKRPR